MSANGWGIFAEVAGNMNGGCSGWEVAERKKGAWTPEEDKLLTEYVNLHGDGRWSSVAQCAGLNRSGKSCRLRWVNYLRPGLKRGQMTPLEEAIIIELHALWGNKWSTIARYLPGRTDNEIKNYWRTHFKNKEKKQEKLRSATTTQVQEELQQRQKQHKYEAEDPMEIGDDRMIQPLDRQESDVFTFPMALEDQYRVPRGTIGSWLNHMEEDELWDGLWDLDGTTIWEFGKLGDVF